MNETQYNNEQIYQALVCLKAEGLSNQENFGYAKELFDFGQQNYVNTVAIWRFKSAKPPNALLTI